MQNIVVSLLLTLGLLTACDASNSTTPSPNNQIDVPPLMTMPPMPLALDDTRFPIMPAAEAQYDTGRALYEQYCSSCHGLNGKGQQPDPLAFGMAPPHTDAGHTWHHPDQQNFQTVWTGRTVAGVMPSFAAQLTPDEIIAVLAYIKTWWSEQSLTVQLERTQSAMNNEGG